MSNNLCIDPAWRGYYKALEVPMSQEPERCEEADTADPVVATWYDRRDLQRDSDSRALLLVKTLLRPSETPSNTDVAEIALRQEWGPTELRFADMDPEERTANKRLYQEESPWTLRGGQNHSGFDPRLK